MQRIARSVILTALSLESLGRWLCPAALFSLLLLSQARAATPPPQYRVDHWTTDNGLPQNSVYAITQTRDGYLWLTTLDGLVRFDSVRFTVFDQSNSPGLTSNRFTSLYEDAEGTLWIGTEDGGVVRYRAGSFTSITTADGLPGNGVWAMRTSPQGGVLFLTNNGIAQYRDGKVIPYAGATDFGSVDGYLSSSGARWLWDQAGLHQMLADRQTTYPIPLGGSKNAARIIEEQGGAVWATPAPGTIFRVKDGVLTRYTAKDGVPANFDFQTQCEDRQRAIWFGASGAGLLRFKEGRFTSLTTANGLSSNHIRAVFLDREGTIWIGTSDRGLNRLRQQFITSYSTKDGLVGNNVYPIFEDRAGTIWIGATLGLSRFSNGVFSGFAADGKTRLPRLNLQALGEDREGRLWLSDYGNVGWLKDGKLSFLTALKDKGNVQAIYQDSQDRLWFGTSKGLVKLKDSALTTYTTQEGLPGDDIKVIHEDRRGQLWFGAYGGLAQLKDGRFIRYTTKDGLASNRVRALYEDADGTLWIGTYDGGLSRLKDGRITTYTMAQGLFNNGAFQILEDGRGNLWLSSNRGIYQVSKQQLADFADGRISDITCVAYGKQDGMLNTECNGGRQPGGIKARDGKLWFPTQDGVVVIDPEAVPFNAQPPPVLIETVRLDGHRLAFRDGVRIKPGQSSLEIHYTGLSYVKPEQVRFKYQLLGQDSDWVDAGTRRTVNYSYLPPGDYTFNVIAANSDSVWNKEGSRLQIVVLPPFYRTWWFISMVLLSIAGLALLIHQRRIAQLQRTQTAQAAFARQLIASQENERQRIAAELHDGLGQSLAIIRNRAVLSLEKPANHERALGQLGEIAEAASQALDEVKEIAYNLRPYQLDRLGLTKALQAMLDHVGSANEMQFVSEIDRLDGLFPPEAEINLYRIVQESLSNIIKHAEASEARVTIKREARSVVLTIQDNGKGFDPELALNRAPAKRSFGLLGIAERVRMLGGKQFIYSLPGKGTTLTIKLGLPNERKDEGQ